MLSYSPQWTDCDESCWLVWCFPQWTHIMHQHKTLAYLQIFFLQIFLLQIYFLQIYCLQIYFLQKMPETDWISRRGPFEKAIDTTAISSLFGPLDSAIQDHKRKICFKKVSKPGGCWTNVYCSWLVFNELKLLLTLSFRWHNTFRNIRY